MMVSELLKPKVGFLGMGWIGRNRFEAVHESGLAGEVSVCDPFSEDLAKYCRDGDITNVHSYDDLLSADSDGIVIATPSAMHKEHVAQALAQGKAVFCQKPLACSARDTEALVQLAREKDCLLMVDFSYRYTHAAKKIKQLVDEGELGHVFAANFVFHNAYGPDKRWYYNMDLSGGGCVMDLGIHLVDLLQWFFPDAGIEQLHSSLYTKGERISGSKRVVEDYATVQMVHTNGMTSQCTCSWNISAGKDCIIQMDLYGTEGGASFRNVNGSFYDFKAAWNRGTKAQVISMPPYEWSGKAILDWTERLSEGNSFNPDAHAYLETARIIDWIYGRN